MHTSIKIKKFTIVQIKLLKQANNDFALDDIIFGIIHEIDEEHSLSNFHYACFSFEQCIVKT